MRTCGSVQSRKGSKSPFGEGSGDGLDRYFEKNLAVTNIARQLTHP